MKPFTESEMIRIAKAADIEFDKNKYYYQQVGHRSSIVTTDTDISIRYDRRNRFSVKQLYQNLTVDFDILAVADTIREILKERGDDNTSN